MLIKEVRDGYARYAERPSEDPIWSVLDLSGRESRRHRNQMMAGLVNSAQPFVLEPHAKDVVDSLDFRISSSEELGPALLEAPFPFPTCWFEYDDELPDEDDKIVHFRTGVLLKRLDGGGVFTCSFTKFGSHPFAEPELLYTIPVEGNPDAVLDPFLFPRALRQQTGSIEERKEKATGLAMATMGLAAYTAVRGMHLISARQGPLDQETANLMSRQERRRLERQMNTKSGPPPTITRIRVNDQGRAHLASVDEAEGGPDGARRRAHRVRGHFMKTSAGKSWRKAHVRGFGEINETVRQVDVAQTRVDVDDT